MNWSEIGIAARILFRALEFLGIQYYPNRKRIQAYIDKCMHEVEIIVNAKDFPSEGVDSAHETIKQLQSDVPSPLGAIAPQNTIDLIDQALYAARIYYWVRHFYGKPTTEILEAINARSRCIVRRQVHHNSYEDVIQRLKFIVDSNTPPLQDQIEHIHQICLTEISELKKLQITAVVSFSNH